METQKERIAKRKRVREWKRARIERGAVDVPMELGNRDDEQMPVRHVNTSGGYIIANQHEEKIMRDIQVSKRGSEAAVEEQSDEWWKTVRFKQEAPSTSASSDPCVALKILRVVRHQVGRGRYLCRSQVILMTTYKFLRWMHSTGRMDEGLVTSEKCWRGIEEEIKKRSELNELVEPLTCLNALERKRWKINPKILTDEKSWRSKPSPGCRRKPSTSNVRSEKDKQSEINLTRGKQQDCDSVEQRPSVHDPGARKKVPRAGCRRKAGRNTRLVAAGIANQRVPGTSEMLP